MSRLAFTFLAPLWSLLDWMMPKRTDYWAFSTHPLKTGCFIENPRAIFECVKKNPSIKKIIFYRGKKENWQIESAVNFEVVRLGTLRSFIFLAQCKVVLLSNSISMDFSLRWPDGRFAVLKLNCKKRIVVNLWHGVALKRLLTTANTATQQHTERVPYRTQERRHYAGLIVSSDVDSYAMAAMFYPLNYQQVWLTGLPRNDFLTQPESLLPRYISDSLQHLRRIKQGKKLIIYAPTYRQTSVSNTARYYQFSTDEIASLKDFLLANNAILGYRPHYFKNSDIFFNLDQFIDNELIFDMSQAVIPEYSAIARELDVLVTDYSSVYMEALYLNKPVLCFGYDIEHYCSQQDGLLYDMELAFPGPVVQQFVDLLPAIAQCLQASPEQTRTKQATARRLFFKYHDSHNSQRVVERIEEQLTKNQSAPSPPDP